MPEVGATGRQQRSIRRRSEYSMDWKAFADAWVDESSSGYGRGRAGPHSLYEARRFAPENVAEDHAPFGLEKLERPAQIVDA